MAIRFQCPSCTQPIEVDDVWAGKTVACPYCRRHVAAPLDSTLAPAAEVPYASPLGATADAAAPVADSQMEGRPANRIAAVALMLAVVTLGFLTAWRILINPYLPEIESARAGARDFSEIMQASNAVFLDENGVATPEAVLLFLCLLAGGAAWVAATVCGIVGATRAVRRKWAVAALVICGVTPIVFCCGG